MRVWSSSGQAGHLVKASRWSLRRFTDTWPEPCLRSVARSEASWSIDMAVGADVEANGVGQTPPQRVLWVAGSAEAGRRHLA